MCRNLLWCADSRGFVYIANSGQLGQMVASVLEFGGTSILISAVVAYACIPTTSVYKYIQVYTSVYSVYKDGVPSHHLCYLLPICISLVAEDVELLLLLFLFSFSICLLII